MTQQVISLPAPDGVELKACLWPLDDAVGHVHIAHGMSEHAARYARFAAHLNACGYSVSASDHRGHGETAHANGLPPGHAGDADSWHRLVDDLDAWWSWCHRRFCTPAQPGAAPRPLIVLGHSMGSFMTLAAATATTVPVAGIILVACGVRSRLLSRAQARLIRLLPRLPGLCYREHGVDRSAVVQWSGFGAFNRRFRPNRTAFDWLNRDEREVDAYIADPWCGQACSLQLWSDFLDGVAHLQSVKLLRRLKTDVPMLLLSGTRDPVGDDGTGAPALAARLRRSGVHDVQVRLFTDARHELLNETNRADVYAVIGQWLAHKLQRK